MLPDCSFMDEPKKSRSGAVSEGSKAMRAALISQVGTIQTMWLPDTMEGRYRFHDDLGFPLPLYIESKDGCWAAFAEKNTFFHTESGQTGSQIVLSDQLITKIHIREKEYALYTEANPSRDSLFGRIAWQSRRIT